QIYTRAAAGLSNEHAAEHRDGPSCGDHHPPRVGGIRLAQHNTRIDSIAEEDENESAHKFAKPGRVHRSFFHAIGRAILLADKDKLRICGTKAFSTVERCFAKWRVRHPSVSQRRLLCDWLIH